MIILFNYSSLFEMYTCLLFSKNMQFLNMVMCVVLCENSKIITQSLTFITFIKKKKTILNRMRLGHMHTV